MYLNSKEKLIKMQLLFFLLLEGNLEISWKRNVINSRRYKNYCTCWSLLHCIVEQQVVFMWGSSYISMTSLVEHSETQPTECLFLPKKGKLYLLKLFESLSHTTFTDLNYDDLIIKGLKITKIWSNIFSMSI